VRGVLAVTLAFIPAWISFQLVEEPVRRRQGERLALRTWSLRLGAACTALSVAAGLGTVAVSVAAERASTVRPSEARGAASLPPEDPQGAEAGRAVDDPGAFTPSAAKVRDDVPAAYPDGCHVQNNPSPKAVGCTYGDPKGSYTVALLGDSHAAQWAPTLQAIAEQRGWKLLVYTKSSCPLTQTTVAQGKDNRPYAGCAGWNDDVLRHMARAKPDVVVTSATSYLVNEGEGVLGEAESERKVVAGMRSSWKTLVRGGAQVVALADTPRPGFDMAECVSANEGRLSTCAVPRQKALAGAGPTITAAAKGQPGVRLVDLNDYICPDTRCAPVIGRVLVYRDEHHITATYARTLAGPMLAALGDLAGPARS
jgi:hypothetical protein